VTCPCRLPRPGIPLLNTEIPELPSANLYQAATSEEKLRGKYYTPPELVRLVLEQMAPATGDTLLDPSCGDGEFLVGAAHFLLASGAVTNARDLASRLIGFDVNEAAVAEAKVRLTAVIWERLAVTVAADDLRIYCANALDLPDRNALEARLGPLAGRLLIVGNPPYVEAKRLAVELKVQLKKRYPSAASGAPDLYLYFLHVCLDWLNDGDRLALVLPNRILVNTNGRALRERLLARRQLRGIDFATRTQIFPGAAVYPVVLYAGGPAQEDAALQLASILRLDAGLVRSPLPDLALTHYRVTACRALFPTPEAPALANLLEHLVDALSLGRVADVLDIRWSVSFHRQGLREQYVQRSQDGMQYPQPFLGGGTFSGNGDVERYRTQSSGWWINYDAEALRGVRNQLPPLQLFHQPKIAICQNSRTLRTAFDDQGYVLKDTLLCGVIREADHPLARHPRALVGLLSSQIVHFYYSHLFHGGHVNGGYLHFLRSFLDDIPLGDWTDVTAAKAERLVLQREGLAAGPPAQAVEAQIEALVAQAFGVEATQLEVLHQWADADENWQARDRFRRRAELQTNDDDAA
jgi:SAM-dependent methyltransferase